MTSKERVAAVFRGEMPDRRPVFDLLSKDAVIERFAGQRSDGPDRAAIVHRAFSAGAVDATRGVAIPQDEGEELLPSGQKAYRKRQGQRADDHGRLP